MRVVVISEHYHPQIGGAERVSQAIAEASAAEGWDTHVFTSGKPSDVEHLNDVTIHRFEISGNMTKGIKGDTRLIRKHLNELHPEVIVVYALQTWGADILLQNGNTAPSGARVILVPCGLSALSTLTRRLYYFSYLKRLKRDWQRFDHYIFHTRQGNDYRFLGQLTANRQTVIPNFFPNDILDWSPSAAEGYLRDRELDHLVQRPFVLNVSNHYRIKGHATLIRKFLQCFPDDWQLVIAGGGANGGRSCEAECQKNSVNSDRIVLLDGTDRKLVLSLYHQATLFFLTSEIEYFPLVLVEAQAIGLPFLSFPVGNVRELNGGIVSAPGDITPAFIGDLLEQPALLKTLGARGQAQSLAAHSESQIQQQYVQLIRDIVATAQYP